MDKLQPGDPLVIGAYRLLARLGAGGMGHVYLARSDRGRTVAVKLVRRELAAKEEFRARFRQEVQAARRVGGYWTAPVLDADTEAPVPWVATGYVAGPSLQQVVGHDHGALPERSVRILGAGLAQALRDIHAAGIVHRDLKPSNVLVTIDGPRVIDFGIARALETVSDAGLTRTGALVGSPGFMAPEQVRGDRITPACDVFCLGSVLAYAATGALPFGAADSGAHVLMFRIAEEEPDLTGMPEGLADLVRDCLRKDPAARPSLERILERTGAEDTVSGGRLRDPWLPGALVAQLGRHAVQLLDTEDPEGAEVPVAASASDGPGGAQTVPGPVSLVKPAASPEHAPAADDVPAEPGPPTPHRPTQVAGQTPAAPPATPAHGHPQQHPHQAAAYGYPQQQQPGAYGAPPQPATYGSPQPPPAYGHPHGAFGSTPPYGPLPPVPPEPPRRDRRSTALLVVVALIVALGAGGSVYALMSGGGDKADDKPSPTPVTGAPTTPAPTTPAPTTGQPSPTTASPTADGVIPAAYLGTWTASITNADGENTRRLTIRQGRVGDAVLSLVADGPTSNGSYHCVFQATLTQDPGGDGPLEMGPSTVTSGAKGYCSPGDPTEISLLPDGSLQRLNTGNGEQLTYTRR
ncbi:protein kinase domain-containing protein [Streptomyces sp. 7R007]